ncbi:type III secretion HpaP family protein [Roseateles amylovorans]|uniref:Type III secretion HpaP family protein n=1 Tax=Roseateles amylovorans TaxID=2978473 RepID=A0ABY6B165_9BURK|nr:type III secretion HpaP family protein [Roseateles amylovorans]UXH78298.1 type III secretion HpaP family protein [Roseateles amylovorans]
MTDEEVRRIRRIIEGPPVPPPPVDPRQAERFQRALGSTRRVAVPAGADRTDRTAREEKAEDRRKPETPAARDASPSAGSSRTATAAPTGTAAPADGQRPLPPVVAVPGIAARETAEEDGRFTASPVVHPPLPTLPVVNWTPLPQGWDAALVDTISLLCRSSDPNFHSWTILVPLNPETLPHTELRLSFSPHRLQLRFSTQSTRSLALVSAHHEALRGLLRQALPDDRHIDIEIT